MSNTAAYLPSPKARIELGAAALEEPNDGEVLIRNYAVAINPIDVAQQDYGIAVEKYPHISGIDIAGEIVEVGQGVTRFKKGDRVVAMAIQIGTKNPVHAGFQLFTIAPEFVTARIPDHTAFTNAVVLPLALSTAAAGLFEPSFLGLEPPTTTDNAHEQAKEKILLVWGGSSSVGSCAIQLAKASGYTVLTTASEKNNKYVRDLGADHVFDHANEDVVQKLIDAAAGKTILGAYDAISTRSTISKCAEFLHHFGGGNCFGTRPGELGEESVLLENVRCVAGRPPSRSADGQLATWMHVWKDFIEGGLKIGKLRAKPDPMVLQGGLEVVQDALDRFRQGVSAVKVVVKI